MKLRTDLLQKLRPEDVMESVEMNNHRYKAEPLFSKTGTGSLSSASISERASEVERNTGLIRKLTKRVQSTGKRNGSKK
ncbi:MAG: hypothetical protein RL346_1999 [Verrucomicrobiota bacterium]|jgi:hypothetical protein